MAVLDDLRELLLKTLREGSLDPRGGSIARRCAEDGSFPLSYGQQRLWLLDQIQSGSRTYNEFSAIRIQGRLDFAVLGRSLNEIVRRHEALRTGVLREALEHQGVAFPRVLAELSRRPGQHTLFKVAVSHHLGTSRNAFRRDDFSEGGQMLDLDITIEEHDGQISGTMQ